MCRRGSEAQCKDMFSSHPELGARPCFVGRERRLFLRDGIGLFCAWVAVLLFLVVPFLHNIVAHGEVMNMSRACLLRLLGRMLCYLGLFGQMLPVAAEVLPFGGCSGAGRLYRSPFAEQRLQHRLVRRARRCAGAGKGRIGPSRNVLFVQSMGRSASEAKEQQVRSDRCARARARESRLASANGCLYREGRGGAREYISDAERGELARLTRQDIESNCRR